MDHVFGCQSAILVVYRQLTTDNRQLGLALRPLESDATDAYEVAFGDGCGAGDLGVVEEGAVGGSCVFEPGAAFAPAYERVLAGHEIVV